MKHVLTIFRMLIYIWLAGLFIFLSRVPTYLVEESLLFSNGLFALTAAFIYRRPEAANIYANCLVALLYAIYTDDGLNFGAFSLLALAYILHSTRPIYIKQTQIFAWLSTILLYAFILVAQNLILVISNSYSYSLYDLGQLILSFGILFPLFDLVIRIIFRTKRDGLIES